MGIFDKLLGKDDGPERQAPQEPNRRPTEGRPVGGSGDAQAIERYRYLLKTAPPEAIEQAHEEAFAQLSPEQRRTLLEQLRSDAPEYERGAATSTTDDPRNLAKLATRAEMRQPGTLERVFGGAGAGRGGIGFGGLLAGSFLSSVAGTVIGSMVAQQFFAHDGYEQGLAENGSGQEPDDVSAGNETAADSEMSGEGGDDFGGGDFGDFEV